MEKPKSPSNIVSEEEIDILEIVNKIWNDRKLIAKVTVVFFITGLLIAILSEKEFTAKSTFVPQTEDSVKGGSLSGLASLAGINLGGMGTNSEIPPSLYPKIVNSVKFKRALLQVPVTTEEGKIKTTYEKFYEQFYEPGPLSLLYKYTLGLPSVIFQSFRGEQQDLHISKNEEVSSRLIRLDPDEIKHFERLANQIQITPNEKEGTVELTFTMPQALMAAEMAKAAEELLQQEVISYKITNAREQLRFVEEQFQEKRIDFIKKQKELANFRDRNLNISSAVAMNRLKSLEAEYNFAFNIYNEMAKQLEQTKLQVSKDTPVFAVINPVSIPIEKSAPDRLLILFGTTIAGLICAIGLVFLGQILIGVKEQWRSQK